MGCGASAPAKDAAAPEPKPAAADITELPVAEQPAVAPLPDIDAKPSMVSSPAPSSSSSGGGAGGGALPDVHASSKKVQSKLDAEMDAVLNASATVELKEEIRKQAKEMFDKMDMDGSGKIEVTEFHGILQKLGMDIPSAQFDLYAKAILTNYDRNIKDNTLDFKEFAKFYSKCLASEEVRKRYAKKLSKDVGGPQLKAAAKAAFAKYDADSSGFVEVGELRSCLTDVLKLELTEEQWAFFAEDTIKRGDKNGDGKFDFHEFLNLYKKCLADDKVRVKFEEKITLRYADGEWKAE